MIKTESYEICPGAMLEIYDVYSDEVYIFERPTPEDEWSLRLDYCLSGLGTSAFYDRFGKIYGTSPAKYIRDYRLEEAAMKLSSSDEPVQKIAAEAGYVNFSKFSSTFRRLYDRSPSEYRRKYVCGLEQTEEWSVKGRTE